MSIHTIRGDRYLDGFHSKRQPLVVELDGGGAYELEFGRHRLNKIVIDSDGAMRLWGAGVSFVADAGELERVGLHEGDQT